MCRVALGAVVMADFDAIYEDSSVDAVGGGGAAGGGAAAISSLEDTYAPGPLLVPDPVVVKGAGNITV